MRFVWMAALLAVGLLSGWFARGARVSAPASPPSLTPAKLAAAGRIVRGGFDQWVHPILSCDLPDAAMDAHLAPVRARVAEAVKNLRAPGDIDALAVYFHDLDRGGSFGIDADHLFPPASLLKVPVMIAALRAEAAEPGLLGRTVVMPESWPGSSLAPEGSLEVGKAYPVATLVDRMIIKSDNDAKDLLHATLGPAAGLEVLHAFGLGRGDVDEFQRTVSPRSYARVLRALYDATYLDARWSAYAIALMSRSEFGAGLVAGTPKEVRVANKFGHRVDDRTTPPTRYLHDCGIIYQPERPYVLCVMSHGGTVERLAGAIADISRVVYRATLEHPAPRPPSSWPERATRP